MDRPSRHGSLRDGRSGLPWVRLVMLLLPSRVLRHVRSVGYRPVLLVGLVAQVLGGSVRRVLCCCCCWRVLGHEPVVPGLRIAAWLPHARPLLLLALRAACSLPRGRSRDGVVGGPTRPFTHGPRRLAPPPLRNASPALASCMTLAACHAPLANPQPVIQALADGHAVGGRFPQTWHTRSAHDASYGVAMTSFSVAAVSGVGLVWSPHREVAGHRVPRCSGVQVAEGGTSYCGSQRRWLGVAAGAWPWVQPAGAWGGGSPVATGCSGAAINAKAAGGSASRICAPACGRGGGQGPAFLCRQSAAGSTGKEHFGLGVPVVPTWHEDRTKTPWHAFWPLLTTEEHLA